MHDGREAKQPPNMHSEDTFCMLNCRVRQLTGLVKRRCQIRWQHLARQCHGQYFGAMLIFEVRLYVHMSTSCHQAPPPSSLKGNNTRLHASSNGIYRVQSYLAAKRVGMRWPTHDLATINSSDGEPIGRCSAERNQGHALLS